MKIVYVPVTIDGVVESLYLQPRELSWISERVERVVDRLRHASNFSTIPSPDDYKYDSDVQPLIWAMHHVAFFVGGPATAALRIAHRAVETMLPTCGAILSRPVSCL